MTAANFEFALALTLKFEGGYADNPSDPGGATNMGVTRATLARVRGRPVSKAEVASLTRAEAADIYRKFYWDAVSADALPSGVDAVVFDHAVNSGPGAAMRMLRAVRELPANAPISDARALSAIHPVDLVRRLCEARRASLSRLKTFPTCGRGWMARVAMLEREATKLAARAAASAVSNDHPALKRHNMETTMPDTNILQTLDPKPFWASQTIWSSIAVIGSSATGAFLSWNANDMAGFGASLTALLGGVNAVVGRFKATGPIG